MPAHARRLPRRVYLVRRIMLAFVLVLVGAAGAWPATRVPPGGDAVADAPDTPAGATAPTAATPTPTPTPDPEPVVFTLVTAGDVLPHATVNRNAAIEGGYDYVPLMEPVRPWIENADIALCSLEVPLAPAGEAPSAYPVFGAPEQLISSLGAIGWDGCATATNHSLDRGVPGLERTLEVMDAVGLGHTGTGRSPEETVSAQFYEVEKDGATLTLAHLSATTFHNDYTDPSQYPPHPPTLDAAQIVEPARQAGAGAPDIVLFTPHWGQEYWDEPDGLQQDIAATLAASGQVDLVLGGHSHVPQPLVKLDGGPDGGGMWVGYSMGNFLSNQDEKCCDISPATGLLLRSDITHSPGGDATVTAVTWSGATIDTAGRQRLYSIQQLRDGTTFPDLTLGPERVQARWADLEAVMGLDAYLPAPPEPGGAVVTVVPR